MHDQSDLDLAIVRRERLDAKIEQTIKRLIQLKAAKQAYRQPEPKVITAAIKKSREASSIIG